MDLLSGDQASSDAASQALATAMPQVEGEQGSLLWERMEGTQCRNLFDLESISVN